MLFLVESMPETMRVVLAHSQEKRFEFPLAIQMFQYTFLCIRWMRSGKLYKWSNAEGSPLEAFNYAYKGAFLAFACLYIKESHDIKSINILGQRIEADAVKEGIQAYCEELADLEDEEAAHMMQELKKWAHQDRLQRLQQENHFEV